MEQNHPQRRAADMVCNEHSNMMAQFERLNNHFEKLLDPDDGILVSQKVKIDRLEVFKSIVCILAGAVGLPVLGAIGLIVWDKLK